MLLGLVAAGSAIAAADACAYTTAQADAGRALYAVHCAQCHGADLEGAVAPALKGAEFAARWTRGPRTVGDLDYVLRTTMPRPAAGSLTDTEYTELLSYVLNRNGVAPGTRELEPAPDILAAIRLPGAGDAETGRAKVPFITGEQGLEPTAHGPDAAALSNADDGSEWLYHTKGYTGRRYAALADINRENVAGLIVACLYQLGSVETFIPGPIVADGVMYVTTPRITAAIDAADCHERWQYVWQPQDDEPWPNNRGVAVKDGYVVRGTADGYLIALDAASGRLLWARQIARPAAGEAITMPPLIYEDLIIVGPAGSETNVQGWVGAFRLMDGRPVWRFNTVPRRGEPGAETWQNTADVPVGGGAVWTPVSLDVTRGELYVAVSNPAPDFPAALRPGRNLYTNSLVALDVRTGTLRWYEQLVPNDDKDWDLTQVSPLIDVEAGGRVRHAIVTVGKDGVVRTLDRDTHERLYETRLGTRLNEDAPVTVAGTRYCPGTTGGVQWNGPAWHPGLGLLYVPTVEWCYTVKLEETPRYVPGTLYFGGTYQPDAESSGLLTALDAATGAIRWQYHSSRPMVAGVTATAGGLVLTGELDGTFIALDAADGRVLYRFNTGGAIAGGVVTYRVRDRQYIAAASGHGSIIFSGRGAATVIVFALPGKH